jgi:hypothetical protein
MNRQVTPAPTSSSCLPTWPGFEGVHGVRWTIENAAGQVVYRTSGSTVPLD